MTCLASSPSILRFKRLQQVCTKPDIHNYRALVLIETYRLHSTHDTERLSPTSTVRVKEWSFTKTHDPVALAQGVVVVPIEASHEKWEG